MKRDTEIDFNKWYRLYTNFGGIHSKGEFERFSRMFLGILKTRYGEEILNYPGRIDFGSLISDDDTFIFWVDYTGSIKEARIYIKSLVKMQERGFRGD